MRVQADILDRGPHNREATHLGGEDINLIDALSHIAKQTFDGIGGLKVSVYHLRKLVKREGLLFLFSQASHRFPDSVSHIWRVLAANWTSASWCVSCCQIATSSA
jgi:hypothetical protein